MIKHIEGQSAGQTQRFIPRHERSPVLILGTRGCHIDVYTPRPNPIDVHFVNVPFVETAQAEITAELVVEQMIPQRHREIYYPTNKVFSGTIETITPLDYTAAIEKQNYYTAFTNGLSEMGRILRDGQATG